MRGSLLAIVVLAAVSCGGRDGDRSGTTVFAASSLTEAAEELLAAEADGSSGNRLSAELVVGGSAVLAAQIRDGAPADLFLSADRRRADEAAAGCDPNCPVRAFATNSLVLAVPAGNPADVSRLEDLGRPELRVVLCDRAVPCGELGHRVTSAAGVDPDPDSLVSSVRAVRSLLEIDEADVGLIYATDVTDAVDVVPDDRVGELETTYFQVVLGSGGSGGAELADFISGPTGQAILGGLGFGAVTP